jgi:hypothetical protein
MVRVGFEPTITVWERTKIFPALDFATAVIDPNISCWSVFRNIRISNRLCSRYRAASKPHWYSFDSIHPIFIKDFKLSQWLDLMKCSRPISRVSWLKITGISGTIFDMYHLNQLMGIGIILETSVFFNQLTRLIAWEQFIGIYLRCQVTIFVFVMISFYSWRHESSDYRLQILYTPGYHVSRYW